MRIVQEGRAVVSPTITLAKKCRCDSSSSGPRIIVQSRRKDRGIEVEAIGTPLACDACDEPWEIVDDALRDGRAG